MAAAATMYPAAPNLGYAFNTAPAATHTLLNTSALPSWAPAAHNGGWMPATAHCSKFVSPQPFLAFDELSAAQLEHDLCQMELDFADPDLDLPGAADCLGIAGSSPRDIEPLPLPSAVQAGSAGAAGLGNADLSMTIRCHWCGGMKTRTGLCHSASCTQRRAADKAEERRAAAEVHRGPARTDSANVFSMDEPATAPAPKKRPAPKKKAPVRRQAPAAKKPVPAARPKAVAKPNVKTAAGPPAGLTVPVTGDRKRDQFVATLYKMHDAAGSPVVKIPLVAKVPLDLYSLHQLVQEHGGFAQVVKEKLWKPIAVELGISLKVCTDYGFRLRNHYERFLLILDGEQPKRKADRKRKAPAAPERASRRTRTQRKAS